MTFEITKTPRVYHSETFVGNFSEKQLTEDDFNLIINRLRSILLESNE